MRFANPGGFWISVLLMTAFGVIIALGVRQAWGVSVRARRLTLIAMRVVSALAALLFALQPQWISERVQNVQGGLVVLVDAPRSMSVRDVAPSRAGRALELLRRWGGDSKLPFDLYAFGAEA